MTAEDGGSGLTADGTLTKGRGAGLGAGRDGTMGRDETMGLERYF